MGQSEDYLGTGGKDTFCPFETFSKYALEILAKEGVGKSFVPVGDLKGSHLAIELAAQGGAARVSRVVISNPLILSPTAKAFINQKLIPMLQNVVPEQNGSQVLAAWNDPSAGPF